MQAAFAPNTNQWYHLADTRSGTLFTIYVNGVAQASGAYTPPVLGLKDLVVGRG